MAIRDVIAWSTEKKSAHGSLRSVARRFGTVSSVKAGSSVFAESSAQVIGVETELQIGRASCRERVSYHV